MDKQDGLHIMWHILVNKSNMTLLSGKEVIM